MINMFELCLFGSVEEVENVVLIFLVYKKESGSIFPKTIDLDININLLQS